MLEKVRYTDLKHYSSVEAFTGGYAYDDLHYAYLLSVGGRESSVKAVVSGLLAGYSVRVGPEGIVELERAPGSKYRVLGQRLPSGLMHEIVAAEEFFTPGRNGRKLLYLPEGRDAARAVYETIKRAYAVPMIPEWSDWLYEKLQEIYALRPLLGTVRVMDLKVDEELLDELISEGVKTGELSF